MKYLLPLAFILFVTAGIDAQCNLTLKDAPAIRGLRFGMSGNDVIAMFGKPFSTYAPDHSWTYRPQDQLVKGLDHVMMLELRFDRDRLIDINVAYSQQFEWKDAREFAENVSTNLNLPLSAWQFEKYGTTKATMVCKEFTVDIDTLLTARLHFVNTIFKQAKADDEKQRAEEWKKIFKP